MKKKWIKDIRKSSDPDGDEYTVYQNTANPASKEKSATLKAERKED